MEIKLSFIYWCKVLLSSVKMYAVEDVCITPRRQSSLGRERKDQHIFNLATK
jgi:hypothetical protein